MLHLQVSAKAAAQKAAPASGGLSLTPVNSDGTPVTSQDSASTTPTLTPVTVAPATAAAAPTAASTVPATPTVGELSPAKQLKWHPFLSRKIFQGHLILDRSILRQMWTLLLQSWVLSLDKRLNWCRIKHFCVRCRRWCPHHSG